MKIKQVLNEKSSASRVKQLLISKRNGRAQVRTFAIMIAENPHSKKLNDLSNLQYNKNNAYTEEEFRFVFIGAHEDFKFATFFR